MISETQDNLKSEKARLENEKIEQKRAKKEANTHKMDQIKLQIFEQLKDKKRNLIEELRIENEKKLFSLKENLAKSRSEKIQDLKRALEKKKAQELDELNQRLTFLQNEILNIKKSQGP